MHMQGVVVAIALLSGALAAQLDDLQPGRNFPTAASAFGTGRSENLDVGDADNDGDIDVVVANGGDGSPQLNPLYLNQGGIQGGVEGTFLDVTATRIPGAIVDTSRDVDLVDWDGDGDLDLYVANRGTTVNGGEVSRTYLNQGGKESGSIGFFSENTASFWGTLVDVPLGQEDGVQDGQGPFRDFTCDCEFADMDDDGDLDLFHSSYGPNINGAFTSRVFLNDGVGRFDELWPWANPTADTKMHTFDIDIADYDGDFDLDVFASSRNSQARVFRNNLSGGAWAGDPFTDITGPALLDNGAAQTGGSNYEVEFGDLDGDGDFDVWLMNYNGFTDKLLQNDGGEFFVTNWIKGDPNVDDEEVDFLDYDGDGDLDTFNANFSGTNYIYQSSLAQGIAFSEGVFHRTGTGLAPNPEAPSSGNGSTTLDGECADMDGDGDTDILLANDNNAPNKYWENTLGVPDTHAPDFAAITQQGNKSDGSDTIIHAVVLDNDPYYIITFHDVDLFYSVGGGAETCVQMWHQGGQQFRAVIPGELDGTISYRVEATDGNGNTGASAAANYVQTSAGTPLWENLGCGTSGVSGDVYLSLSGDQVAGQSVSLRLRDAAPSAFFLTWLSFSSTPFQALGGDVYAFPFTTQVLAATDAAGMFDASTTWPPGVPSGTQTYWQSIVQDASSIHGLVLSNAVRGTSP